MKVVGIGDRITIDALRLMGIDGTVVTDEGSFLQALEAVLEPDTVILVSQSAANLARRRVEELKSARSNFMVIELPGAEGAPTQAEETARLVSQAIGIRI